MVRLALVAAAMRETLLDCLKDNPLHSLFPPDILDEGAAHVRQRRVSKPNLSERRAAVYVAADRLLEEICVQGGHKVVVFSEWERMQELAAAVATRLKVRHVRLHGGVPSHQRAALIERFREDPACQIFFSTDAGGVGLNLQAADHVINLDLPWNPAVLAQRIARVHRLGQKNAVNAVLMVAENSIESRMEVTLEAKRGLFEATVGDDTTTDQIERTGLARRIATLLTESFAAPTGPVPGAAVEEPQADPVRELQARLGGGMLQRLMRTRDGRLVGIIADGLALPPAEAAGPALMLPAPAAEALAVFGETSPLAGAEILFEQGDRVPKEKGTFYFSWSNRRAEK